MKHTRNILMTLFVLPLLIAGALYVMGDFLHSDLTFGMQPDKQTVFVVSTTMILLTLAVIPLSLYLFKIKAVNNDLLARKEKALKKWGSLRLVLMGTILVANTFLYYAFAFESSFGYLAVIVLLTFAFIVPTMNRCIADTEPEPEPEPELEDELDASENTEVPEESDITEPSIEEKA